MDNPVKFDDIMNRILDTYAEIFKEKGVRPLLIIYVGRHEYAEIRKYANMIYTNEDGKEYIMGFRIVQVIEPSYLHVTPTTFYSS